MTSYVNPPPPDPLPRGISLARHLRHFPHYLGLCERLFRSTLRKKKTCVIETAAGIFWKLDLENSTHRWIVYGDYEGPALNCWMKLHLQKRPCILLSGANIGQMIPGIYKASPHATVHAFEPNIEALSWLKESLRLNSTLPVMLHEHGLGEEKGHATLLNDGDNNTHGAQSRIGTGEGHIIQIEKLDDVMETPPGSGIDLWILDVEGFELSVLKGASQLLSAQRIKALWMEACPETEPSLSAHLSGYGYQPFHLDSCGRTHRVSGIKEHSNLLYLPFASKQQDE